MEEESGEQWFCCGSQERRGCCNKTMAKVKNVFRINNITIRQMLAEALSTFILMDFGLSCVAQVVLGKGSVGQYLSINIAFGIGVTLGIYAAGKISGAHMNAAITITQCVLGNISAKTAVAYVFGQFLGSFLAAAAVFALYYDALYDYTNGSFTVTGPTATAMIFSTYPASNVSLQGAFFSEFTATVMLMLGILVIHDEKNNAAVKGAQPMLTGILVVGIGLGMGLNTGYAINPSRDLPPRIFTAIAGWGMEVFSADHCWWWIPVTAPTLGSLFGVLLYKLCIEFHIPPEAEPEKDEAGTETSQL
ncbi:aquaporin-7-like [Ammospiza nelsoni]|uniref:aquaporin-7-like n=1 Tax=Ammospiza caudacuta TaxID=2857398 RepID=UPI00273881E7|nr:aquaporin-7-like [Ammospiza caudacuta]XP_059349099.1 aquaporin-7-like [Ammospiza nelsoni]